MMFSIKSLSFLLVGLLIGQVMAAPLPMPMRFMERDTIAARSADGEVVVAGRQIPDSIATKTTVDGTVVPYDQNNLNARGVDGEVIERQIPDSISTKTTVDGTVVPYDENNINARDVDDEIVERQIPDSIATKTDGVGNVVPYHKRESADGMMLVYKREMERQVIELN